MAPKWGKSNKKALAPISNVFDFSGGDGASTYSCPPHLAGTNASSYTIIIPYNIHTHHPDTPSVFSCLIEHANSWLDEHQAMTLVSCETLTWPGMKTKHIFSDSTSFVTSMNTRKSTKYLRGLR